MLTMKIKSARILNSSTEDKKKPKGTKKMHIENSKIKRKKLKKVVDKMRLCVLK